MKTKTIIAVVIVIAFASIFILFSTSGNESPNTSGDVNFDDEPFKGSLDAAVEIIEYSDFQCPFCGKFATQVLPQIKTNYIDTGKVKLVYKDFPLSSHKNSQKAAEAAECADDQGKFWEYHDKLFANQKILYMNNLKKYASELGLDTAVFNACLDSGKYAAEVQDDFKDGQAAGVSGTPTFFINGVKIVGAQPYSVFQQAIERALN